VTDQIATTAARDIIGKFWARELVQRIRLRAILQSSRFGHSGINCLG